MLGGLGEDHHGKVREQHAGEGEALALAAGQPGAVLAGGGRRAQGQRAGPGPAVPLLGRPGRRAAGDPAGEQAAAEEGPFQ